MVYNSGLPINDFTVKLLYPLLLQQIKTPDHTEPHVGVGISAVVRRLLSIIGDRWERHVGIIVDGHQTRTGVLAVVGVLTLARAVVNLVYGRVCEMEISV